jgi:C-8 sterol isomerase
MMRVLTGLGLLIGALSALFYALDSHLEKFYIFDPTQLHEISQAAIKAHGNDTAAVLRFIVEDLSAKKELKAYVNLDEEWMFNNAGGAMGAMYIIHASITEYLIIFGKKSLHLSYLSGAGGFNICLYFLVGTAIGTEGHSGRHTADDYFHILRGTQFAYTPGTFEPEVYPQGSVHHLRRGDVKQYKMDEACFALEYARGWIPPMLGFGYADSKFPNRCLTACEVR